MKLDRKHSVLNFQNGWSAAELIVSREDCVRDESGQWARRWCWLLGWWWSRYFYRQFSFDFDERRTDATPPNWQLTKSQSTQSLDSIAYRLCLLNSVFSEGYRHQDTVRYCRSTSSVYFQVRINENNKKKRDEISRVDDLINLATTAHTLGVGL